MFYLLVLQTTFAIRCKDKIIAALIFIHLLYFNIYYLFIYDANSQGLESATWVKIKREMYSQTSSLSDNNLILKVSITM